MEDYIEYKKARAEATKTINKKKDNFKKSIESINKNTNISYVWSKMRILKNASKTIEWTKWQKNDRKEECIKVMYDLSPCWVQEDRRKIDENPKEKSIIFNCDILKEETSRAIECCKLNSVPGLDHIKYCMIY